MAIVTKTVLKTYFEQGDIPTQGQYVDLIESQFSLGETDPQIIQGIISASNAEIEYITLKKLYIPGIGVSSDGTDGAKVGSTFSVGKTLEISGSMNVTQGNITITSSGEFQGENAKITNISGSFISASGHIYSAGHITSSGNIRANGTTTNGTGSFGRVEVATRLERTGDQDTAIEFSSDTVKIIANNIQGAKFGSSGGVQIGNTTYAANITGSTISLSGNLTASNATFTTTTHTGYISASSGINATDGLLSIASTLWNDGLSVSTARRAFSLTFTNLPAITAKNNFADEVMLISNEQITTKSVIISNQAAASSLNTQLLVSNVVAGRFTIKPYCSTGDGTGIVAGGSATYNFVIL
tara:strand:+ start:806 stop:1873 length:1068 start_codon:yes stop_codon:yes gene_type:complete